MHHFGQAGAVVAGAGAGGVDVGGEQDKAVFGAEGADFIGLAFGGEFLLFVAGVAEVGDDVVAGLEGVLGHYDFGWSGKGFADTAIAIPVEPVDISAALGFAVIKAGLRLAARFEAIAIVQVAGTGADSLGGRLGWGNDGKGGGWQEGFGGQWREGGGCYLAVGCGGLERGRNGSKGKGEGYGGGGGGQFGGYGLNGGGSEGGNVDGGGRGSGGKNG